MIIQENIPKTVADGMLHFMSNFMHHKTRLKVLAIAEGVMPSTEICLSHPLTELRSQGFLDFEIIYETDIETYETCKEIDLIIALRSVKNASIRFIMKCKARGIPLLAMFDDDFLNIPPDHWLYRHYKSIGAERNVKLLLEMANRTAVFTEELRSRYSEFAENIFVLPVTDWASTSIFSNHNKSYDEASTTEFRIGYAGSPTHEDDIELISEALLGCLDRLGDGYYVESIGQKIDLLSEHPRYRHFDFIDGMDNFFKFLATRKWQIGLAPMRSSLQNNVKTENKFRTYAISRIPGIYSEVEPFSFSVRHNDTGILVSNNGEEWENAIVSLAHDEPRRDKIASSASVFYHNRYNASNVLGSYRQHFNYLAHLPMVLILVEPVDYIRPRHFNALDSLEENQNILVRICLVNSDYHHCLCSSDVVVIISYKTEKDSVSCNATSFLGRPVVKIKIYHSTLEHESFRNSRDCLTGKPIFEVSTQIIATPADRASEKVRTVVQILKDSGLA